MAHPIFKIAVKIILKPEFAVSNTIKLHMKNGIHNSPPAMTKINIKDILSGLHRKATW